MAKDRIGSSKTEGPGLLQDGVWTAEKKKACVRWGLNLISCDRNEQRVITCQGSVYIILGGVMNQAYHWKLHSLRGPAGPHEVGRLKLRRVKVFSFLKVWVACHYENEG